LLQRKKASESTQEISSLSRFPSASSLTSQSPYVNSHKSALWTPTLQQTHRISFSSHPTLPDVNATSPISHSPTWNSTSARSSPPGQYASSVSSYHETIVCSTHCDSQDPVPTTALPIRSADVSNLSSSFMPQTPRSQTPPPFQYSSSSLSTALSEPTLLKPLPPVNLDIPHFPTELSYDSNSPPFISVHHSSDVRSPSSRFCEGNHYTSNGDDIDMVDNPPMTYMDSQHSPQTTSLTEMPLNDRNNGRDTKASLSPYREAEEVESSGYGSTPVLSPSGSQSSHNDLYPSSSSTHTMSPLSSPHISSSLIELPLTKSGAIRTISYSGHYHYSQEEKLKPPARRRTVPQGPPRLNSELPATSE
jgi:hypothetical protein